MHRDPSDVPNHAIVDESRNKLNEFLRCVGTGDQDGAIQILGCEVAPQLAYESKTQACSESLAPFGSVRCWTIEGIIHPIKPARLEFVFNARSMAYDLLPQLDRKVEAEEACLSSHDQRLSRWCLLVWTRFTKAKTRTRWFGRWICTCLQRSWYSRLRSRGRGRWTRGKSLLVERQFRSNRYKFIQSLLEYMVCMTVVYH